MESRDPVQFRPRKPNQGAGGTDPGEDTATEDRRTSRGGFRKQLALLQHASPDLYQAVERSVSLEEARERVWNCLQEKEKSLYDRDFALSFMERATSQESIRVLKAVYGSINEARTGTSALDVLWKLVRGNADSIREKISRGFLLEFIHLFRGMEGKSHIYRDVNTGAWRIPQFLRMKERKAALKRSSMLDSMSEDMLSKCRRYRSGLEPEIVRRREANRDRILAYFGSDEAQWNDFSWQLGHVVKDARVLADLIDLPSEEGDAVKTALENSIPFGVTPYYISLMDREAGSRDDHAVRAQVIPPPDYVTRMADHKSDRGHHFDFMGEHDTSPEDLITRRYPRIAILKPYNTCSQICVYCQRNWEIEECMADDAMASEETLDRAIEWFKEHPGVGEVLITGGDPIVCSTEFVENLLSRLSALDHIYRLRFGTRTPVVLPMRWTDDLVKTIAKFHEPGKREICVVTHFSHSYEITPQAREAVQKIRRTGMSVYNQQVFTIHNSRRFETVKLRMDLKSVGVDPYYTFNMKGKEETHMYMVPVARILQERKEEARLLPGLDRTDEPVFNVPRLGKNHLRAWQDHRLIMIRPDGKRVYEFHPWEKNIALVPPYLYTDLSIYEYLQRLREIGEDPQDYDSIWYYF